MKEIKKLYRAGSVKAGQNKIENQIPPTKQLDQETIISMLSQALAAGSIHMDDETTIQDLLEAQEDGRVHFVTVDSFADFDITNMRKIIIP